MIADRAEQFGVDPFLLAGLMYDRSGCWPTTPKRDVKVGRFGLTRIPVKMHARQIRDGVYTYYVREGEQWVAKTLSLDEHRFNRYTAAKPDPNIYFAAAFLKILKEQDAHLDKAFESVPHRHFVSHWFYGDRVRQVEPENRVLRARRRMIAYYNQVGPIPVGDFDGVPIVSPLDGVPRLSIDYFGNRRGKKTGLGHRGIDLDGHEGEPVRAMADGIVTFAGVDKPGSGEHELMEPKEANLLPNDQMGPGGLYVHIAHANELGTIYIHLKTIDVSYRQEVKAGQIIGTLGRSGTETPGPHLHLELRKGTGRVDPAVYLKDVIVDPHAAKVEAKKAAAAARQSEASS